MYTKLPRISHGYRCFVYKWDLICIINRFILKVTGVCVCVCVYTLSPIHIFHSVPLTPTPSVDKNWITERWACLEESTARSLTVISLLFQSTTHCPYRVYTKFLLTYTAIYRRNRKVLLLGITALQPQSHFYLGTPYIYCRWIACLFETCTGCCQ
jgi:hypothetical protein